MSIDKLSADIWNDVSFQDSLHSLKLTATANTLPKNKNIKACQFEFNNWFHLLRCAAVLIESLTETHHDAALRIIYTALQLSEDENVKAYAISLLAIIANDPSINLAISRGLVEADILDRLPALMGLEISASKVAATISFETEHHFLGNIFQNILWTKLEENQWVTTSAPTSAGKSFVLEKWIQNLIVTKDSSNTFYVVPTRALISQVEKDLRQIIGDNHLRDVSISTLPLHFASDKKHNIFIYTQERFHLFLLNSNTKTETDLVIIDEAHKIGDDTRGILLQQVLELAAKKYRSAKFLFASPSTDNPEALLNFAPDEKSTASVMGTTPTVNQNLYWLVQKRGKPKEWLIQFLLQDEPQTVAEMQLENKPSTSQKLPFIGHVLGGSEGGNVIYVNGAADAENAAELIYQLEGDLFQTDSELIALSDFCEKAVHPEFLLRKFILKGIAFHYGNMPQLVREEIERLFSNGKIKFLICTSTLIEGVNLACKNIFLRHPKRGQSELMRPDDFWNLAGRAGRWGKEFQGNIFCIDPLASSQWHGGEAPRSKRKQSIEIATFAIGKSFSEFLSYVNSEENKVTHSNRLFDQLLSYFIFRRSEFGDLGASKSVLSIDDSELTQLTSLIDGVTERLNIPISIVNRNPSISPFGMVKLLEYFRSKGSKGVEELLPSDPLSEDAVDSFLKIFSRISKYLGSPSLGRGASAFGNALLVVNWMQGWPLARLIDGQIKYDKRTVDRKNLKREKMPPEKQALEPIAKVKPKRTIIRDTMARVEKIARYEAPKYLHCYLEILNIYLIEIDRKDLKEEISDLWMFLEFGVSKKTQLSLISLGVSRSTVMILSEKISNTELDEIGVIQWLKENNWLEFGFPELVTMELNRVMNERKYLAMPS